MKKALLILVAAFVAAAVYFYDRIALYREVEFCIAVTADMGRIPHLWPSFATAIEQLRTECPGELILLDNGGFFDDTTVSTLLSADMRGASFDSFFVRTAGYRFINLTPDAFLQGAQQVRSFLRQSGAEVVTLNLQGLGAVRTLRIGGFSVAVYGIAASARASLLPEMLYGEHPFQPPFSGDERKDDRAPSIADFELLLFHGDLAELSMGEGIEPIDVLLSLYTRFPHLSLVVMNDRFPPGTLEGAAALRFAAIDRKRPALFFAKVRMLRRDEGDPAAVTALETRTVPIESFEPDGETARELAVKRERETELVKRVVGIPWFGIDLSVTRSGDSPAARLYHETLFAIASAARHRPDISVALVPTSPFRVDPGGEVTLADIGKLVPNDRYPVLLSLTGLRLTELLQSAGEKYPIAVPTVFPLYYTVRKDGSFIFSDGRYDPDRTYNAVVDGRIADLLFVSDEVDGPQKTILPETIAQYLVRAFPLKLTYAYTPLWRAE